MTNPRAVERDCNTCIHHTQGASIEDASSLCRDCATTLSLPNWTPTPPAPTPSDPLKDQVGGSHYKDFAIQPITFAMLNGLNFCQANVIKYICRRKGNVAKKVEDLEKAIHIIRIYQKMLKEGVITLDA